MSQLTARVLAADPGLGALSRSTALRQFHGIPLLATPAAAAAGAIAAVGAFGAGFAAEEAADG